MTYGSLPEALVEVDESTVLLTGGPARVVTDAPDPDFVPSPLLGFGAHDVASRDVQERRAVMSADPLLWEGDQA